jgi:hypothetical protein
VGIKGVLGCVFLFLFSMIFLFFFFFWTADTELLTGVLILILSLFSYDGGNFTRI